MTRAETPIGSVTEGGYLRVDKETYKFVGTGSKRKPSEPKTVQNVPTAVQLDNMSTGSKYDIPRKGGGKVVAEKQSDGSWQIQVFDASQFANQAPTIKYTTGGSSETVVGLLQKVDPGQAKVLRTTVKSLVLAKSAISPVFRMTKTPGQVPSKRKMRTLGQVQALSQIGARSSEGAANLALGKLAGKPERLAGFSGVAPMPGDITEDRLLSHTDPVLNGANVVRGVGFEAGQFADWTKFLHKAVTSSINEIVYRKAVIEKLMGAGLDGGARRAVFGRALNYWRTVQKSRAELLTPDDLLQKALFIGPRGGKWADSKHTIPWKPPAGRKIHVIDMTGEDDLESQASPESEANVRTETTYFASGANRASDIRGFNEAGHPLGVSIPEVIGRKGPIKELLASTVPVFVDSGAFSEVEFGPNGPEVVNLISDEDWELRLDFYQAMADAMGNQVTVVAPDMVGFPDETLERLRKYKHRVAELVASGARVLLPLQGPDKVRFYAQAMAALGLKPGDVIPALPMNKNATTAEEAVDFVARVQPAGLHLLGISPEKPAGADLVQKLRAEVPDLDLSADSNRITAKVGTRKRPGPIMRAKDRVEEEQKEARFAEGAEPGDMGQPGDYTDMVARPSEWMSEAAKKRVADALGLEGWKRKEWLKDPDAFLQSNADIDPEFDMDWKWWEEPAMQEALDAEWAKHHKRTTAPEKQRRAIKEVFTIPKVAEPKKYSYGMPYRPAGYATVPKGYELESHADFKHGVVTYDRPLTPEEIKSFQLVPILDQEQLDQQVAKVVAEMSEYADEYAEMADEDPRSLAAVIRQQFEDLGEGPVHVDDIDAIVETIKNAVVQAAKKTPSADNFETMPEDDTPVQKVPFELEGLSVGEKTEFLALLDQEQGWYLRGWKKALKAKSKSPHQYALGVVDSKREQKEKKKAGKRKWQKVFVENFTPELAQPGQLIRTLGADGKVWPWRVNAAGMFEDAREGVKPWDKTKPLTPEMFAERLQVTKVKALEVERIASAKFHGAATTPEQRAIAIKKWFEGSPAAERVTIEVVNDQVFFSVNLDEAGAPTQAEARELIYQAKLSMYDLLHEGSLPKMKLDEPQVDGKSTWGRYLQVSAERRDLVALQSRIDIVPKYKKQEAMVVPADEPPPKPKGIPTPQVDWDDVKPAEPEKAPIKGAMTLGTYQDGEVTAYYHPVHGTMVFADTETGNWLDLTTYKPGNLEAAAKMAAKKLGPSDDEGAAIGQADYEERQEAKRERLEERAEAAAGRAASAQKRSRDIGQRFEFGQPIIVGHHSEKKARRDRERMDTAMRTSIEEDKKAERLAQRAASLGTGGISSDDPEAVVKLLQKVARLEAQRERMKVANRKARKEKKPKAHAGWELTNLGATIRTAKKRIERLRAEAKLRAAGSRDDIEGPGFVITEDLDDNRIKIIFPGKPEREVLQKVKAAGFKWNRYAKVWQRMLNAAGRGAAERVAREMGWEPADDVVDEPASEISLPAKPETAGDKTDVQAEQPIEVAIDEEDPFEEFAKPRREAVARVAASVKVGKEYSSADGTQFGAVLKEISGKQPLRVQWYDKRGLIGHAEVKDMAAAVELLVSDLGTGIKDAPGSMDKYAILTPPRVLPSGWDRMPIIDFKPGKLKSPQQFAIKMKWGPVQRFELLPSGDFQDLDDPRVFTPEHMRTLLEDHGVKVAVKPFEASRKDKLQKLDKRMDEITAAAKARKVASDPDGTHADYDFSVMDWMTEKELAELSELKEQARPLGTTQAEAKKRVAKKRAARVKAAAKKTKKTGMALAREKQAARFAKKAKPGPGLKIMDPHPAPGKPVELAAKPKAIIESVMRGANVGKKGFNVVTASHLNHFTDLLANVQALKDAGKSEAAKQAYKAIMDAKDRMEMAQWLKRDARTLTEADMVEARKNPPWLNPENWPGGKIEKENEAEFRRLQKIAKKQQADEESGQGSLFRSGQAQESDMEKVDIVTPGNMEKSIIAAIVAGSRSGAVVGAKGKSKIYFGPQGGRYLDPEHKISAGGDTGAHSRTQSQVKEVKGKIKSASKLVKQALKAGKTGGNPNPKLLAEATRELIKLQKQQAGNFRLLGRKRAANKLDSRAKKLVDALWAVRSESFGSGQAIAPEKWKAVSQSMRGLLKSLVDETLDLHKAQARGGSYYKRVPTKKAGGRTKHRYFYKPEDYDNRDDAHLDGEATSKAYLGTKVAGCLKEAGEKGCGPEAFKDLVKKYGSKKVAEALRDGQKSGTLAFKKGKFSAKVAKGKT